MSRLQNFSRSVAPDVQPACGWILELGLQRGIDNDMC